MSWTDPCGNCGRHRADCDCERYAYVEKHTCEYCVFACKKKSEDTNEWGSCYKFTLANAENRKNINPKKSKTGNRFVPIKDLQDLMKQRDEIDNKISSFTTQHCSICGDTQPKHGFYPLWGMAVGEGIYQTSGLKCNRCGRNDKEYEEIFGEPKEQLLSDDISIDLGSIDKRIMLKKKRCDVKTGESKYLGEAMTVFTIHKEFNELGKYEKLQALGGILDYTINEIGKVKNS